MITHNDEQFLRRFTDEFQAKTTALMAQGLTVDAYRTAMQSLDRWKNETPVPDPKLASYDPKVELRPGLTAAVAVPEGDGPFPVFVVAHGNGLVGGSSHLYRRLTKDIAAAGYVTITPDFRLAPEHPFPAGHDDVKLAVYWARDNASKYSGDGSRIVLWGDSMAAGLALGVVLTLQDEQDAPAIKAFVGAEGFYEVEGTGGANPMADWYPGGPAELANDKRVSPLRHLKAGMTLPSIFLITGTHDFAMVPALDLALKLGQCGLHYQLHVLEGMPHDFMKFPELDGKREGHQLLFDYLSRCV